MSTLISIGLVVSALLVFAYIIGTELCLPRARRALRTGDVGPWLFACRLVTAGEWAIIALCGNLLVLGEHNWQLFTATVAGTYVGLSAAALVIALVVWELGAHSRKHYARIISASLDLVLPESGRQRELYERLRERLENGSVAERCQVLRALVPLPDTSGN